MAMGQTIVAAGTAPGRGTRAMVRVSGNDAFAVVACALVEASPRERGVHRVVMRAGRQTCAGLVVALPGPGSFTGQDTAELVLPANAHLLELVMGAMLGHPAARLAQPGEFTARAFLAGKLTLEQAEGVAAFIAAQQEDQLNAARELKAGLTGALYRDWADELTTLLALVEAGIDFTDQEDVVPIAPMRLRERVARLRDLIDEHMGAAKGGAALQTQPVVALVGVPNAGKSTLFNALLGRQRAVASARAGTTRDVIAEELDLSRDVPGAGRVLLQDLPGLSYATGADHGDASVQTESDIAAQQAAREGVKAADTLLWCDPTGRFEHDAMGVLLQDDSWRAGKQIIRVQTFGDQMRDPQGEKALRVCAVDGWNLSSLRRALADQACVGRAAGVAALLPRYRRSLTQASAALEQALDDIPDFSHRLDEPETVAESLRVALTQLGELVGNISPDDVLGRVFATFCVGK